MLRLLTLGDLRLEGAELAPLSSRRKELVLLAFLARRGPRPLGRAELASLLWQDRDERRSRQSLRQALSELHRLFGEALVVEQEQVTPAGSSAGPAPTSSGNSPPAAARASARTHSARE